MPNATPKLQIWKSARWRHPACPRRRLLSSRPEALDRLVERAARAGLPRARADRARRRDRLRRPRVGRRAARSAGPTSRTAAPTGSSAATTRRASATPSARTRGSASSSRRASASGARARTATEPRRSRRSRSTTTPLAFIGVRSCELHAIEIQDRVFIGGKYVDRDYAARRDGAFLVAVNCHEPGGTCFCASMGTGPKVAGGLRPRADRAARRRAPLPRRGRQRAGRGGARRARPAAPRRGDLARPQRLGRVGRGAHGPDDGHVDIRDLLARNLEHPRWDEVAERCLTCGNCTLVCPTCFCSAVEDATDLTGDEAERCARLGHLLLGRLLVHPRRQHPPVGRARATGSG